METVIDLDARRRALAEPLVSIEVELAPGEFRKVALQTVEGFHNVNCHGNGFLRALLVSAGVCLDGRCLTPSAIAGMSDFLVWLLAASIERSLQRRLHEALVETL